MHANDSYKMLKIAIQEKETGLAIQKAALREHLHLFVESLKPMNLIKAGLGTIGESLTQIPDATDAIIGYSSGFLARKLFSLAGNGFLMKGASKIIELIVAAMAIKNAASIKAAGANVIHKMMNRTGNPE
jgi:hypothetical protein